MTTYYIVFPNQPEPYPYESEGTIDDVMQKVISELEETGKFIISPTENTRLVYYKSPYQHCPVIVMNNKQFREWKAQIMAQRAAQLGVQ